MSMKKCPYCAEDVQDEAIKCKHCGEWLNEAKLQSPDGNVLPLNVESDDKTIKCNTCEIEKSSENFINELSICKDCSDKEPQNSPNENIEETDHSSPIKEKRKWRWGWGWFILLLFFLNALMQYLVKHPAEAYVVRLAPILGVFFLLFIYFKLRKWMFTWHVFYFRNWMASMIAGTIAFFVITIVVTTSISVINKMDLRGETKIFLINYQKKAQELKQEELEFDDKIISDPSSEADLQHNIKILDEYLIFMNKRINASQEMIDFINKLSNKQNDKSLSQHVQNLQLLRDRYYDVSEKSIKALMNYYKNVDDNAWNKYEKLSSEQQKLEIEFKSAIKQLFTRLK